jgi:hypothetical protein
MTSNIQAANSINIRLWNHTLPLTTQRSERSTNSSENATPTQYSLPYTWFFYVSFSPSQQCYTVTCVNGIGSTIISPTRLHGKHPERQTITYIYGVWNKTKSKAVAKLVLYLCGSQITTGTSRRLIADLRTMLPASVALLRAEDIIELFYPNLWHCVKIFDNPIQLLHSTFTCRSTSISYAALKKPRTFASSLLSLHSSPSSPLYRCYIPNESLTDEVIDAYLLLKDTHPTYTFVHLVSPSDNIANVSKIANVCQDILTNHRPAKKNIPAKTERIPHNAMLLLEFFSCLSWWYCVSTSELVHNSTFGNMKGIWILLRKHNKLRDLSLCSAPWTTLYSFRGNRLSK